MGEDGGERRIAQPQQRQSRTDLATRRGAKIAEGPQRVADAPDIGLCQARPGRDLAGRTEDAFEAVNRIVYAVRSSYHSHLTE